MTDRTLLDNDPEPAHLTGYGPIPAPLARSIIRGADPTITITTPPATPTPAAHPQHHAWEHHSTVEANLTQYLARA